MFVPNTTVALIFTDSVNSAVYSIYAKSPLYEPVKENPIQLQRLACFRVSNEIHLIKLNSEYRVSDAFILENSNRICVKYINGQNLLFAVFYLQQLKQAYEVDLKFLSLLNQIFPAYFPRI